MSTAGIDSGKDVVIKKNSVSVAGAPLPVLDPIHKKQGTILLFYQYKEPIWRDKEHKRVLKDVIALGTSCGITGRGRVAPEGLNCTLSGTPEAIRKFCAGLRQYDPLFLQTDFKLTDGVAKDKLFKSLSIRKTKELVAYGLGGDKAPSLKRFAGNHLEADEYHKAMQDPKAVIIDVRNAYESAIGSFRPPPGGAELIDPKMRNSIEFPKWLADESTQKKLNGKKVLMYCTGGIRCERATALLNQMESISPNLQTHGVFELQGGIERYVKTYPQGGFWKGKNYLFDRRFEQTPGDRTLSQVEHDIDSKCVICREKWTEYRGKFKCNKSSLCGVPVIVCSREHCREKATEQPSLLQCELCRVGYKAPQMMPDLKAMKRKAELTDRGDSKSRKCAGDNPKTMQGDRLFLSRLPLTSTKSKLQEAFGGNIIEEHHWLTDKRTGGFYGSCIIQFQSSEQASKVMKSSLKIDKKKVKLSYCQSSKSKSWPPEVVMNNEYPPIGR